MSSCLSRRRSFHGVFLANLVVLLLLNGIDMLGIAATAEERAELAFPRNLSLRGKRHSRFTTSTTLATTTKPPRGTIAAVQDEMIRNGTDKLDEVDGMEGLMLEFVWGCEVKGKLYEYESFEDMSGPWEECIGMTGETCKNYIVSNDPSIESDKIIILDGDDIIDRRFDFCRVLVYLNGKTNLVEKPPNRG